MTRPIDDLFGELSKPLGPTDWPEPAQLRRKAEHKRTVRRVTVASSVAVVAAFAIAVPATLSSHHATSLGPASRVSLGAATPASTPTTAPAPKPTVSIGSPLLAGVPTPTGTRQTFGPVSLIVPQHWTVRPSDSAFGSPAVMAHSACIAPPASTSTKTLEDCAGLQIWYDGFLPGPAGKPYDKADLEKVPAWYHLEGTPTCPTASGKPASPIRSSVGRTLGFQRIGATHTADYNVWDVTCADGSTFTPQGWWLPGTKVLFLSYLSDKAAQATLATAEFPGG